MRKTTLISVCLLAVALATPALEGSSEPISEEFWIEVGGHEWNWNDVIDGGGDGFRLLCSTTPWIWCPSDLLGQQDPWHHLNPEPGWQRQWFYNGPYDPLWGTIVDVSFTYNRTDGGDLGEDPGYAQISINYATADWADWRVPPVGGSDEAYIEHITIGTPVMWTDDPNGFSEQYDLRDFGVDFNPLWVSIEVAGYNFEIAEGVLIHESVPEHIMGDMDRSGKIDTDDIDRFILALTYPDAYEALYGLSPDVIGDCDGSGEMNADDINPFVALVIGGSSPAVPEPATLMPLAVGALALIRRRRQPS